MHKLKKLSDMRFIRLLPLWIIVGMIFISCNHKSEHAHNDQAAMSDEHSESLSANGLQLNNGEKWTADEPTNQGMIQMHTFISKAISQSDSKPLIIKEKLTEQFNSLLKQCTMQGEDHNQLHLYLVPLKQQIDELDEKSGKEKLNKIESYITEYHTYFK